MSIANLQAAFVEPDLGSQGDMPVSDSRFDKLVSRVDGIAQDLSGYVQRTAKIEGRLDAPTPLVRSVHPLLTVVVSAVCIAIVGYWGWIGVRIVDLGERMKAAETTLQPFVLKQIGSLDQQTFEHSLPQLKRVIERTNPTSITDRETLAAIASKLRQANESSPEYWPTVLEFIRFSSASVAPSGLPAPGGVRTSSKVIAQGFEFREMIIVLDGGFVSDSVFRNCRIIITEQSTRLYKVSFINCVFELPVTNSPGPFLKEASRDLLTSDLSSVVNEHIGLIEETIFNPMPSTHT